MPRDWCDEHEATNKEVLKFIREHRAEAQAIADRLHVPVEYILGLSAIESARGTDPKMKGTQNFFSMHHPAPGETGWEWTKGNKKGKGKKKFSKFKDYAAAGASFEERYGSKVDGATTPDEFTHPLTEAHGYNPADASKDGNPTFEKDTQEAIKGIKRRLDCDKEKHSHRCGAECDDFERYGYCDRLTQSEFCWQHS
jgi:hypothetical protein